MEEGHENWWIIIPPQIAGRRDLDGSAKLVFGRVFALSKKWGYCTASNAHLEQGTGLKRRGLEDALWRLKSRGAVQVEVLRDQRTRRVVERRIWPLLPPVDDTPPDTVVRPLPRYSGGGPTPQRGVSKENSNGIYKYMPGAYGRTEINGFIRMLKEATGISVLDGSEKMNRRYAWLVMKKYPDKWRDILAAIGRSPFWKGRATSARTVFYHALSILSDYSHLDGRTAPSKKYPKSAVRILPDGRWHVPYDPAKPLTIGSMDAVSPEDE